MPRLGPRALDSEAVEALDASLRREAMRLIAAAAEFEPLTPEGGLIRRLLGR